jgi:hypothetical protein
VSNPADLLAHNASWTKRWIVGAACLALLAALFMFGRGGAFRLFGGPPGPAVKAEQPVPGAALRDDSQAPPPALRSESKPGVVLEDRQRTMPAEVRAWLEHLERCERQRFETANAQIASSLVSLSGLKSLGGAAEILRGLFGDDSDAEPAPPTQGVLDDSARFESEWAALKQEFASLEPPAECVPIRNAYARTLAETGGMIAEIAGIVSSASADPQAAVAALSKLQGTSSSRIDVAAVETDRGVADVCRRYDTAKWFSIRADVGGGALSKLGGL